MNGNVWEWVQDRCCIKTTSAHRLMAVRGSRKKTRESPWPA